jgi:hypothetical protein
LSDTQLRTVDLLEMVQEGTTNLPADDPAVLELGYHVANPPTVPVWDARDHYPTESLNGREVEWVSGWVRSLRLVDSLTT